MEVLKINENKIKIMLSAADMKNFKLTASELDYNDSLTRQKVFKILEYVKANYGFDHEGDKLLIQFYPSKDGGAEVFVTKLGLLTSGERKAISRSDRVTMLNTRRAMYSFSSFGDLLSAARSIVRCADIRESELFLFDDGTYYLEIMERGESKGDAIKGYTSILEFASPVSRDKFAYITEHSKCLASGNAIELLASLA